VAFAKKPTPRKIAPAPGGLDGIFDAALAIAEKRREMLTRLRKALKANNAADVFRIAKELCGNDQKSNRIN
jgi:hypothetical protein